MKRPVSFGTSDLLPYGLIISMVESQMGHHQTIATLLFGISVAKKSKKHYTLFVTHLVVLTSLCKMVHRFWLEPIFKRLCWVNKPCMTNRSRILLTYSIRKDQEIMEISPEHVPWIFYTSSTITVLCFIC